MVNLILTIVCTTLIGVILKVAEKSVTERLTMLLANYVVATVVSGSIWLQNGSGFSLSSAAWTLAPIGGFIFAFNFFLYTVAIKRRGVALPASLMRLSAIVPIAASIVLFSEAPSGIQTIGMLGALVAAVMMSLGIRGGDLIAGLLKTSAVILVAESLALLFCFGLADLTMKLFEQLGIPDEKPLFLAMLFGFAGLSILVACLARKVKPRWHDVVWGAILGVPNLFSSYFLIGALRDLPSVVVFPSVAAGSVMLIVLIAWLAFREEMGKLGVAGVALSVVSLIAVNV